MTFKLPIFNRGLIDYRLYAVYSIFTVSLLYNSSCSKLCVTVQLYVASLLVDEIVVVLLETEFIKNLITKPSIFVANLLYKES